MPGRLLPLDEIHFAWLNSILGIHAAGNITDEELQAYRSSIELWAYDRGDVVFNEGDQGRDFYVVFLGTTTVTKGGSAIAELRMGAFFGEMSFLFGKPRTATVATSNGCQLFRIKTDALENLIKKYPGLGATLKTWARERLVGLESANQ